MILEPKKRKSLTVSIVSPSICHEVMGLDAMILALFCFFYLSFLNVEFSYYWLLNNAAIHVICLHEEFAMVNNKG